MAEQQEIEKVGKNSEGPRDEGSVSPGRDTNLHLVQLWKCGAEIEQNVPCPWVNNKRVRGYHRCMNCQN